MGGMSDGVIGGMDGFYFFLFFMFLVCVLLYKIIPDPYPPPPSIKWPFETTFQHSHIVAGSGHGKTQLIQERIVRDLPWVEKGVRSVIVIDSQGDLIRNILQLQTIERFGDRFIYIDPHDIECPPALNLFDFGLDRLHQYDELEREKLLNGTISLYEYLFGALLGAELTQRQSVIFRYLARLMMVVPGGTIKTLMEFMKNPDTARPYLSKLDETTADFFQSQFFSPMYASTRQQILARLYGVRSIGALERMFNSEKNKLDVFSAMNRGSLILVNTAKDLLKQEGCEIFGRFMISLIAQATQERAALRRKEQRTPTFLYIDEAHDYFDDKLGMLLNEARKYRVGVTLAHQNLSQFDQKLLATVKTNTAIKYAGGVNGDDARVLAREMQCEPEFILGMRKQSKGTQFAISCRDHIPQATTLFIPFGLMEKQPKMSREALATVLTNNRKRYGAPRIPPEFRKLVDALRKIAAERDEIQPAPHRPPPKKPASSDITNPDLL